MDYNELTIEDCMWKQEHEGQEAIIEDGAVTGFVERQERVYAGAGGLA